MAKKMKYVIKSCPADDTQALQNLLNEMSMNGWELYSMTEIETEENILLNCIFMAEDNDFATNNDTDIISWGTVKNPIEKMISPELTPYEKGQELIDKIKKQKKKITQIKSAIDVEAPASVGRKEYNAKISSSLKEFEKLKKELAELSNPNLLYERLGVDTLSLKVSEELVPLVDTDSEDKENLFPEIIKMRYESADEYGYIIPSIRIFDSEALGPYEFSIDVRGLEVFKSTAYPEHLMFYLDELHTDKKIKEAIYEIDTLTGREIVWIKKEETKDYWVEGISASEYIAKAINFAAVKFADDLFDYQMLLKYCELVGNTNPFLVENLVPEVISFADLRYIFTSLIAERVSIKDITLIFSKLNDFAEDSTREDLLSKIRLAMSRNICAQYADSENTITALEISENTLEKIIPTLDEEDAIVRIDGDFAEKLSQKITKKFKDNELTTPILIAPIELRQMFFNLLSNYIADIVVLSREEIGAHYKLEITAEV